MKKVIAITSVFLIIALLLCSCGQRASYDEDGICRVIDGKVPEDVKQWLRAPSYEGGYVSLEDYTEQSEIDQHIIVRARRHSAESISSKDTTLAYTIAEMEILEIYNQQGELFDTYRVGDCIDILLSYTFVPEKRKATFQESRISITYDTDKGLEYESTLAGLFAFNYINDTDEYIVYIDDMLVDGMLNDTYFIANDDCTTPIISKENATNLFVPNIAWKIDEARYEEMKKDPAYTDRETRHGRIIEGYYNYVYFDILDQYIFGEK